MFIEEITRDLNKRKGWANQYEPIILRRGEKNETQIKVKITNNGVDYPLSGLSAKFCAVLEDKSYIIDSNHVSISGSTVTYTVQDDLTSIDGDILVAYVELSKSGAVLTTDGIPFIVLPNTDISDSEAKKYQSKLDALMEQLTSLTSEANEALDKANSALMDAETASEAAKNANTAANNANEATKKADGATKSATDAAKSANDAAKKVTDAMATFRTIVSETTEYATDTQGTTPPSGGWSTATPKDVKGLWVWVRTTTTYNTGNPDIKYQAVYSGLDGTFTGEDRVTKLEEAVKNINDYTTGINLLRGTRDFKIGTELYPKFTDIYTDGFFNRSNGFTFYKDEEGYTVAKREVTSSNVGSTNSAFLNVLIDGAFNAGDEITLSFDVMSPNPSGVSDWRLAGFQRVKTDGTYSSAALVSIANSIDTKSMEANKWYRARISYTIGETVDGIDSQFVVRLILTNLGTVYFRKVKAERGVINHPIWSPSPFDIESINDETTGINLLKGTRDLVAQDSTVKSVTIGNGNYRYYSDFYPVRSRIVQKENDFSEIVYHASNNDLNIYCELGALKKGDSVTFGFEIKFSDDYKTTNQRLDYSGFHDNSVSPITQINGGNHMMADYGVSPDILGCWQLATMSSTIDSDADDVILTLNPQIYMTTGTVSIRKFFVYKGRVNNPIWSASPFDVAQESELSQYFKNYVGSDNPSQSTAGKSINYIKDATALLYGQPVKGALKIVTPIKSSSNATMIRFKVAIADYVADGVADYYINGYNYLGVANNQYNWYAPSAFAISYGSPLYKNVNQPVKFGKTDDGYAAIEIGDENTEWNHARITVGEIMYLNYSSQGADMSKGWKIGYGSQITLTEIVKTVENPSILSKLNDAATLINALCGSQIPSILGIIPADHQLKIGDDLNNLTIPGEYAATSSAIAAGVKNSPTQMAFKIAVEYSTGASTNYLRQILRPYSSTNEFRRVTTDGGKTWGDFYEFTGTRVIQS